jgi:hypothetical protein
MKVAALQSFVSSLLGPLQDAGVSEKARTELLKMTDCLSPFAALDVGVFADFLTLAEGYRVTGVVPLPTGKAAKPSKPRVAKPPPLSVTEAAQRVLAIYERARDPNLPDQEIDALMGDIKKAFGRKKEPPIELAQQVGITKNLKTGTAALEEIRRMIEDRKRNADRIDFRPASVPGN